jgi:hypothetical protein
VFACAALFAAAPAQAEGEFRDGFEDQLGRLAALEVFHLGHILLAGHAAPYHGVHYVPQPRYYHYGHHYKRHHKHHYRHHYKHPGRHLGHYRQHHGARYDAHYARGLHRGHHGRHASAERRAYRRHEYRDGRGWH